MAVTAKALEHNLDAGCSSWTSVHCECTEMYLAIYRAGWYVLQRHECGHINAGMTLFPDLAVMK